MSRICGIIAHDLARTHVSYYNDDAKRTKGMYRQICTVPLKGCVRRVLYVLAHHV